MAKKEYEVKAFDGKTTLKQQKHSRDEYGYIYNIIERFNGKKLSHEESDVLFFLLAHDNPQFAGYWKNDRSKRFLENSVKALIDINCGEKLQKQKETIDKIFERFQQNKE